jgi:cell division FtsZ-interacting protein ZapD
LGPQACVQNAVQGSNRTITEKGVYGMIQMAAKETLSILEIEISENVAGQDFESFKSSLDQMVSQAEEVDLIVRMENISRFKIGAIVKDCELFFRQFNNIHKIAVVGDSDQLATLIKADFIIPGVECKYFDTYDMDLAWYWLKY